MLRPTLSRFHIAAIFAPPLGALTLWLHQVFLFVVVIILFLAITGLGVAFPQLCFFGKFICRGKNSQCCIALTFDDGPDANSTPQLLDFVQGFKN